MNLKNSLFPAKVYDCVYNYRSIYLKQRMHTTPTVNDVFITRATKFAPIPICTNCLKHGTTNAMAASAQKHTVVVFFYYYYRLSYSFVC